MADGFVMIPNSLIEHSDFTLHELVVYIVLKKYRNSKTGKCYPGLATITDEARISRSAALRTIASLEGRGVIQVERARNRNNVYTVADVSVRVDFLSSAKGKRKPQRNWSEDTLRKRASSTSETPPRAVAFAPSSPEKLRGVSEASALVPPGNPNKTNDNQIHEPEIRSAQERGPEIDITFDAFGADLATSKQLDYCHDLYIHLTGNIPSDRQKDKWRAFTGDDAADYIRTCLKQIPRWVDYDGPAVGSPAYDALSPVGRQWADRGMVPEEYAA